jgi:hypothetical protein
VASAKKVETLKALERKDRYPTLQKKTFAILSIAVQSRVHLDTATADRPRQPQVASSVLKGSGFHKIVAPAHMLRARTARGPF